MADTPPTPAPAPAAPQAVPLLLLLLHGHNQLCALGKEREGETGSWSRGGIGKPVKRFLGALRAAGKAFINLFNLLDFIRRFCARRDVSKPCCPLCGNNNKNGTETTAAAARHLHLQRQLQNFYINKLKTCQ